MWSWEGMCTISSHQPGLAAASPAGTPTPAQQAALSIEEQNVCSPITPSRAPPLKRMCIQTLVCLYLVLASDRHILTLHEDTSADGPVRSSSAWEGSPLILWSWTQSLDPVGTKPEASGGKLFREDALDSREWSEEAHHPREKFGSQWIPSSGGVHCSSLLLSTPCPLLSESDFQKGQGSCLLWTTIFFFLIPQVAQYRPVF